MATRSTSNTQPAAARVPPRPTSRRAKRVAAPPESRRIGLSTELIVDTACALIAESHTDQLTMRRLSERLGVALGATYHYVPDRDSLLVLVAKRINDQVRLRSTRPSEWASTLWALMFDYADAYVKYPGMANFANAHLAETGPDQTQLGLLALLDAAGFSDDTAYTVLAAFFFYTSGATTSGLIYTDQPGYPSEHLMTQFGRGLDLLIEGTKVQLRADKRGRRQG